eukprot:CAMPEP_0119548994 /NCGR_PEP_ID=MMETSP1352-20130426/2792_1 /TAXON_ID=265584 /ORGANISM="Stauroneis constricta, Strain CCMP1120" /LENGTH=206 /DNA_ID=CAMNT_0007594419 /DNA_START=1 /DNA_END=621 /DNA_ORIENTATION=-
MRSLLLLAAFFIVADGFQQPSLRAVTRKSSSLASDTSTASADTAVPEAATTYVRCGRCDTSYIVNEDDLGGGRGRRLECSVCSHTWFQSRDRLMTVGQGFELVELPNVDKERISENIAEGKSPRYMGASKLYIGNVAFSCTEDDLLEVFSEAGQVGEVVIVRDDTGRNRGFAFVTMRTVEGGEKATESLDGMSVHGRNLAVRPANN